MAKIYTKQGDSGYTTVASGKLVKKTSELIELFGSLDELNSFLGLAAEALCEKQQFIDLLKYLYQVQGELLELGMQLATGNKILLGSHKINRLESEIDVLSEKLPVMTSFVLPGGGEIASRLHVARAVCRRSERAAFRVVKDIEMAGSVAVYLNRLSDWLYVAARFVAHQCNIEEIKWSPPAN